MPNFLNTLPEFDGRSNSQTAEDWLAAIEGVAKLHRWPDAFKIESARSRMIGPANNWFTGRKFTNWDEFVFQFKRTFVGSKLNIVERMKNMLKRVQSESETVADYFHHKARLCRELELPFNETKQQIVAGLRSRDLCYYLLARHHIDEDNLCYDLTSFTQISDARSQYFKKDKPQRPNTNEVSHVTSSTTKSQMPTASKDTNRKTFTKLPPRNDKDEPLCFNCSTYGHVSRYCTKPKKAKCEKCGKYGHEKNACFTNTQVVSLVSSTPNTINEKYFFDVLVNEKPVRAYVDTGSQLCLMRKSDAITMGLSIESIPNTVEIRGYGDGRLVPIGVVTVKLRVDCATSQVPIYIVSDDAQTIALIVGQPFTEQSHVVLVKRGDILRIYEDTKEGNDVFDMDIPELPPRVISLWAKQTEVISPKHVGVIEVQSDNKSLDLFVNAQIRDDRCIPSCVITTDDQGKARLPIINLSTSDVHVKENERISRAILCTEIAETQCEKSDFDVESIKHGDQLTNEEQLALQTLIIKYRNCFATQMSELGKVKSTECNIITVTNKPVTFRPYRLSESERRTVREMVEDLKGCGIITDSNSPYASPILLVKKKDGGSRFCVDYRALNKITVKDRYPLPLIEEQIDRLAGMKLYTNLDMFSGYYQIPMSKDAREKTSFITPDGQYEFTRMPFGIANGPSVYQRMINQVLGPLRFTIAMVFMDDVLIPSRTVEDGLYNLETVLETFVNANLTLNLKKCNFLCTEIEYLGFQISEGSIAPSKRKIEAVMNFPRPRDVHNVRQYLGLTGYFRRYVQGYAQITKPLTSLLHKDTPWEWTEDQDAAFEKLKSILTNKPILKLYDPLSEMEVHCDASQLGLGAILLQKDERASMHPVAYASRQTTAEESRYHSTELETLAVVWSLQKFRTYLIGKKFKVITDCAAVRWTFCKKNIVPRIGRWWLQIMDYDFEVEHRAGDKMDHVDALSRNPNAEEKSILEETEIFHVLLNTMDNDDWLTLAQRHDNKLNEIIRIVGIGGEQVLNKAERKIQEEYSVVDGRLYRRNNDKLLWVVPKRARSQITRLCHNNVGHPAVENTLERLRRHYWFPYMKRYVKGFVGSCLDCLYNKVPGGQRQGKLHAIDKIGVPFHTVHVDHLGPFIKGKLNNVYLFVLVDGFTKFSILRPTKNVKSSTTTKLMEDIIAIFGPMVKIVSDRGTAFTGKEFEQMCKARNIIHVRNATATPRANGQCERLNRTILSMLTTTCKEEDDWDKVIGRIQWSINNAFNKATKSTPFTLMFGFIPRTYDGDAVQDEVLSTQNNACDILQLRARALESIVAEQKKMQDYHNQGRIKVPTFTTGDLVMIQRQTTGQPGESKKMLVKYKGPYVITEVLPNDRFRVQDLPEIQRTQRFYEGVVALDQMKMYMNSGSDSCEEEEDSNQEDEEMEKEEDKTDQRPIRVRRKPNKFEDFV